MTKDVEKMQDNAQSEGVSTGESIRLEEKNNIMNDVINDSDINADLKKKISDLKSEVELIKSKHPSQDLEKLKEEIAVLKERTVLEKELQSLKDSLAGLDTSEVNPVALNNSPGNENFKTPTNYEEFMAMCEKL